MTTTHSLILALDARAMQQGADAAASSVSALTRSTDAAAASADRTSTALDRTGAAARAAAQAQDAATAALAREKEAAAAAEQAALRHAKAVEQAAEEQRRAVRDAANLGVSYESMGAAATTARGPLAQLQRASTDLAVAQEGLAGAGIKVLSTLSQTGGIVTVAQRMAQAVAEFKAANTVIDVTTGVTTKAVSGFSAFGGVLASIATNPLTLLIAGITAASAAIGFLTRETDEAKRAAEDHKKALEDQARAAAELKLINARGARARDLNDDDERKAALEDRIRLLEAESVRLRADKPGFVPISAIAPLAPSYRPNSATDVTSAPDAAKRGLTFSDFGFADAARTPETLITARAAVRALEDEIRNLRVQLNEFNKTEFGPTIDEEAEKRRERVSAVTDALGLETAALQRNADETELLNNLRRAGLDTLGTYNDEQLAQIAAITESTRSLQAARKAVDDKAKADKEHELAIREGIEAMVDWAIAEGKTAKAAQDGQEAVRASIAAYAAETEALRISETARAVEIETRRIADREIAKGHELTEEEREQIRKLVEDRLALIDATKLQTEAERKAQASAEQLLATQKQQREEAEKRIADLQRETEAIGKSSFERERARALADFDAQTKDLPGREDLRAKFDAGLIKQNYEAAKDHLSTLREENALVGLTAEERRRILEYRELEDQFGDKTAEANRKALELIQDQREELERMERIAFSVGDTLTSGLEDALYGARDLSGVLLSLSRIGFSEFVGNPLRDAIGSGLFGLGRSLTASANGNVFGPGGLHYFADGGIVTSPTFFGFGAGQRGVMGEAGPEAVIPLERGANGKLGLAGGGGVTIYQTINIGGGGDVYGGVHRSTRQALEAARSAVGSG